MPEYSSATELFTRILLPRAIIVHMPLDVFWDGDPELILSYFEAYNLDQKTRNEYDAQMADYSAWLTGSYVERAIAVVFQGKNGHEHYPKRPISFKNTQNSKIAKKQEEAKLNKSYLGFYALSQELNRELKKKRR